MCYSPFVQSSSDNNNLNIFIDVLNALISSVSSIHKFTGVFRLDRWFKMVFLYY